jgi:hypothetical protein
MAQVRLLVIDKVVIPDGLMSLPRCRFAPACHPRLCTSASEAPGPERFSNAARRPSRPAPAVLLLHGRDDDDDRCWLLTLKCYRLTAAEKIRRVAATKGFLRRIPTRTTTLATSWNMVLPRTHGFSGASTRRPRMPLIWVTPTDSSGSSWRRSNSYWGRTWLAAGLRIRQSWAGQKCSPRRTLGN